MHFTGARVSVTRPSSWTVCLDRARLGTAGGSRAGARYVGIFPAPSVGLIARDPHVGHHEERTWLLWRNDVIGWIEHLRAPRCPVTILHERLVRVVVEHRSLRLERHCPKYAFHVLISLHIHDIVPVQVGKKIKPSHFPAIVVAAVLIYPTIPPMMNSWKSRYRTPINLF